MKPCNCELCKGFQKAVDQLDTSGPDYCGEYYWRWEASIVPKLAEQGYGVRRFFTQERDGFGPLVRGIVANVPNHSHELVAFYG